MTTRFCQDIKKFVTSPRRLPSKRIYTFTRWVQAFKVGVWDGPFCKCAQEKCTCVLYICEYERHICHICINLWMYMNIMCIYIYSMFVCLYIYIYMCEHTIKNNDVRFSTSICRRRSPPEASKNPTTLHQAVTNPSQIFAEVSHEHG